MQKTVVYLFALIFSLVLSGCENTNENEVDIFSASKFDKKLNALKPLVEKVSTTNMVLIKEGFFKMGSNEGQLSNQPEHDVFLDSFYIDKFEATYGEYLPIMNKSSWRKHRFAEKKDINLDMPVTWITWFDAAAYCKLVGKRLPTEAEWEKAARGGTTGLKFPWGNTLSSEKANTYPEHIVKGGRYPANQFGLYDMIGNVWEYCSDWHENLAYLNGEYKNPQGPEKARYKVIRGGSWDSIGRTATVYDRSRIARYGEGSDIGFRCAMDAHD
ncbi:MAG: SUMF1/EgtB/PvdO family nonheme iron enzyme [Nitrospinae bacterium]|nr:SUMF1/EgtB/PvdO family nonheme iron enzyme [Nitrospinota bacterium]